MHADFHELTDIAAGRRPVGDHVSGCWECRKELARVRSVRERLAALGPIPAPLPVRIDPRAGADGASARPVPDRVALALAASILLLFAAAIVLAGRPGSAPTPSAGPLPAAPRQLVAESERLEALLAGLPERSTTRLGTAYTIAALEDQLALVDDRLTNVSLEPHAPELSETLWRERVTLLESLVEVRYARMVAMR